MLRKGSAILVYHSFDETARVFSTSPINFRQQVETIRCERIPVVPLRQIRQTNGAICLTFDDGFRNFTEHALPVLLEYQIPATLFVVSGYCGKSRGWASISPPSALDDELLSWTEVREYVQGNWQSDSAQTGRKDS